MLPSLLARLGQLPPVGGAARILWHRGLRTRRRGPVSEAFKEFKGEVGW
jgi:hypothetical protein